MIFLLNNNKNRYIKGIFNKKFTFLLDNMSNNNYSGNSVL